MERPSSGNLTLNWFNMKTALFLIACLTIIFSFGCVKSENDSYADINLNARSQLSISKTELVTAIERKDVNKTIEILNHVKTLRYQGDFLPLIVDLWDKKNLPNTTIDTQFLDNPIVRLELADVLLQAAKNETMNDLNPGEYVQYALELISHGDNSIVEKSLLILAIANRKQDVVVVEEILLNENVSSRIFNVAAIAYGQNCYVNDHTLSVLFSKIKDEKKKKILTQKREELKILRSHICTV